MHFLLGNKGTHTNTQIHTKRYLGVYAYTEIPPNPIYDSLTFLSPFSIEWGFPGGSEGKESACNARDQGSILGSGKSLEKGMATHSSIVA